MALRRGKEVYISEAEPVGGSVSQEQLSEVRGHLVVEVFVGVRKDSKLDG